MAGNGGKYVVSVLPALKKTGNVVRQVDKLGRKIGKRLDKALQMSLGAGVVSMIQSAVKGSIDKVKTVGSTLENQYSRHNKIQKTADKMGVDSSRVDALSRIAQTQGISVDAVLESLNSFRKAYEKGEVRSAGSDILEKYMNAMAFVRNQKGATRDTLGEQIFGSGLEDLYYLSQEKLNEISRKVNFSTNNTRIRSSSEIKAGAKVNQNAELRKTKLDQQQEQLALQASSKSPIEVITFEQKQTNELLKNNVENLKGILDTAQTLQKAQNKIDDMISDGMTKITQLIESVINNFKRYGINFFKWK